MENSSSFLSSNRLDSLPDKIYHFHLFSYLTLYEILKFRLVNKRIYLIVKSYNIKELSVSHLCKDKWFSTNKSIQLRSVINFSLLPLLTKTFDNLLNLKYLKINGFKYSKNFKIQDLNKFTELEILQIEQLHIDSYSPLDIFSLQALSIKNINTPHDRLTIDTPNLNSLRFYGSSLSCNSDFSGEAAIENFLVIKHPTSVKFLEIESFCQDTAMFSNLEHLELVYSRFLLDFDPLKFKNLKKLTLQSTNTVRRFEHLFSLKDDFLKNLKFILRGVNVKEIEVISEYCEGYELLYQIDNYGDLEDNLNFITDISYNELEFLLPNEQPSNLLKKFSNIQRIKINKEVKDENRLIHFIKECSNLTSLEVQKASLNQQFYNRLSLVSLLISLEINEDNTKLNYRFIMKMPYLSYLQTNEDVLISEKLNLNNLEHLKRLDLKIKNSSVSIAKTNRDEYSVVNYDEHFNHDKLVQFLNVLRERT